MTWSFRTALLVRITIVLVCALGVAGFYTSWRVGQTANELSNRVISQTSRIIDQRVVALLDDTEGQARAVAGITRPTFAGDRNDPVDSRSFPLLAAQVVEILRVNPEFAAISITLDRSGEYVQVGQARAGGFNIQTTQLVAGGKRVKKDWVPFGNRLSEIKQDTNWKYDPRTLASYAKTKKLNVVTWSTADVLQNLNSGPALGTTCSAPIVSTEGEFLGVVSISLTLTDLSKFLKTIKLSPNGSTTLFEVTASTTKIIADPEPDRLMTSDSSGPRLVTIDDIQDRRLQRIAHEVESLPKFQTAESRLAQFKHEGETYFTGMTRISGSQRPPWILSVTVPQSDFLNWSRETTLFFLSFTALALAVGAIVAVLLADRVVKPLQMLARETAKIKAFDWSEGKPKIVGITEIDDLSRSFETLKAGLRSMEKLVPADYARSLIASGQEAKLGGQRRHITTYFGDIIGFTRLSHELPPEELVEVLSEYLDVLSNVVLESGGTLDKFNGDDVMAFWGAPTLTTDHATAAVGSALASIRALNTLHLELADRDHPILSASFGIATGDVIVGNVGSKKRMTYTVIGDSVNLASRLQGLNKFYQTNILASEETMQETGDTFIWRHVDTVAVFGRLEPEPVYQPLCSSTEPDEVLQKIAELSNQAIELFQNRQFLEAATLYEEILADHPHDGPAAVLHARCIRFNDNPPAEDWDGSFHMTLK